MKKIFFITGVNGVGKTAVMKRLGPLLSANFELHDFDERGVPDNVDRQWRIDETKYWIELGSKNAEKNITTIVCGFARPSEIGDKSDVGFVLLDADEKTITDRLRNRYQTKESIETIERVSGKSVEQFTADNVNFSKILRDEAKEYQVETIDTTTLTPEQVAQAVRDKLA